MEKWTALLWGFFKVGLLGYGGGRGSISLLHVVTVDGNHWLSNQQFVELLAIENALPDPIATKLAPSIGYRVGGVVGSAAELIGIVLPSVNAWPISHANTVPNKSIRVGDDPWSKTHRSYHVGTTYRELNPDLVP
ncbi:MAG: chromate transporter [Firmicutes bacterium]|nr:chromate transporter [Bacillota bacterium]